MKKALYLFVLLALNKAAIAQPCNATLTATANNEVPCTGTPLLLFANTIPGATYSWAGPDNFSSNQQNPSVAFMTLQKGGYYTVTAIRGSCIYTDDIYIDLRISPVEPLVVPDTACEGDSVDIEILATGGGVTHYLLDPLNNLHSTFSTLRIPMVSGIYHAFSETSQGCVSDTASLAITGLPIPTIPLFVLGKPACKGDSIILRPYHASGTYDYLFWNPKGERIGAYVTDAQYDDNGIYKCVIISTGGCVSDTAALHAVVHETVTPGVAIYGNTGSGPYGTVTFTSYVTNAGVGPLYRWMRNGVPIAGANKVAYTAVNGKDILPGDEISLHVTAGVATCPGTGISNILVPSFNLSVNDIQANGLAIYPNPNNGVFTITGIPTGAKEYTLEIINSLGRQVYAYAATGNACRVNAAWLPSGMYTIRLYTEAGVLHQKMTIGH